jgi:hypothetical protein
MQAGEAEETRRQVGSGTQAGEAGKQAGMRVEAGKAGRGRKAVAGSHTEAGRQAG